MSDPDALFDEDDLLEQREMRFHDQRDIGDLWSLTLQGLTLMLPPTSIAGSQLSILQQLFAIKRLDIRASPGSPGLKDLDFLPESLLSLSLRGHYELDDMEELSTLTGLTKLVLHDNTEVDEWPHCLTALSTLREIQITASRAGGPGACLQTDGIAVQAPPHRESWLHLPICFFTCQPCLTRLVLQNHHLGLRDVEAFEGLQALVDLDLEGLIFDSYRYSAYESKLLFALTSLTSISLSRTLAQSNQSNVQGYRDPGYFEPLEFSNLGVTGAAGLLSLNLSHNDLKAVPEHLSLLRKLTSLDLSGNLLPSNSLTDAAILALPQLRFLSLAGCMTACLSFSAYGAEAVHPMEDLIITGPSSTFAAVHRSSTAPDVSQLMRACPHLQGLHVCNAA